ncbi:hypothetical protein HYU11_05975 [Candidatus Woesearchaeota archaeon]|nr:hypothetical protein [Candidatus Woesearchaeota archaeon]
MKAILDFFTNNERWHELDKALTSAFEKIKGETRNIYSWVRYFRQKDMQNDLKHDLIDAEMAKHDELIKSLQIQVSMLNEEIKNMQINQKTGPFPDQVRTKSGPEFRTRIEKKMIAISRPIKKDYIIQQISDMIGKGGYSTKQIETIIVREKMLCGRTAFYDYLKEMKLKNQIGFIDDGKKRVIIPRQD